MSSYGVSINLHQFLFVVMKMHNHYPVYVAVSIIMAFVIFIVYASYRKNHRLVEKQDASAQHMLR